MGSGQVDQFLALEFGVKSGQVLAGGLVFMGRYWQFVSGQADGAGIRVRMRDRSSETIQVVADSLSVRTLLENIGSR